MENKRDCLVVKVDRTNFREACKLNGISVECVLLQRIFWRLEKLEMLEDAGLGSRESAVLLKEELDSLFAKLTTKIYGEVNV